MKMLIVDDHDGMREMLRSVFCTAEDEVWCCADGNEAVACYRRNRPDWLVMDVVMKPMDGITAARQITAEFPGARVILITEQANAALTERAREAGACGLVAKDELGEACRMMNIAPPRVAPVMPPRAGSRGSV